MGHNRSIIIASVAGISFLLACIFALPASIMYPEEMRQVKSFVKTMCVVIECTQYMSKLDSVKYVSTGHVRHIDASLIVNGCTKYPTNSTFTCYANSYKVVIKKPTPSTGLFALIIVSISASVCFLASCAWCTNKLMDKINRDKLIAHNVARSKPHMLTNEQDISL